MYEKKLNINIISWITFLTFISGYANCIALLYCSIPIYHHTGNISNLAIAFMNFKNESVFLIISAIISFFLSGVIGGFLFYKKHVGFDKIFGNIMILYSLLYIFIIFYSNSIYIITISTAFIAGSQNSLLTRYKGITTRTTHMTGYLSDCSINLGRALKGDKTAFKHFLFFLTNIIMFFAGNITGFIALGIMSKNAFYIVAILRILAGIFYLKFINKKDIYQKILKNT